MRESTPLRAYLAARRVKSILVGTLLVCLLTLWIGTYSTALPSAAAAGHPRVPLWRMLVMVIALLPVTGLHSQLADLEVVATRRLWRLQRCFLAVMGVATASIYLATCSLVLRPAVLLVVARSWLGWFGLALLSGVLFGWRLAWVMPMGTAMALWYWGFQGGGEQQYHWWEFSARPYGDTAAFLVSLVLLGLGVAAYWATPWRRRRLFRWRR